MTETRYSLGFFRKYTGMPPQSPHFWCHQCQREVQVLMAPDPVCQTCNGQFVEQVSIAGLGYIITRYISHILSELRMSSCRLNQKTILEILLLHYMKKIQLQDLLRRPTILLVPVDPTATYFSFLIPALMRQKTEVHCTLCLMHF